MNSSPTAAAVQWLVAAACAIALLYFGRAWLEPLVMAALLAVALGPLVRKLQRFGFGRTAACLLAVTLVAACMATVALVIGLQLAAVARELPRYRSTLETKVEEVRATAMRPLERWVAEVGDLVPPLADKAREPPANASSTREPAPIPVEIRQPRPSAGDTLSRLWRDARGAIGEGLVTLLLLVFVLFEHDSLRERWVRLAGDGEVARTMLALTDTDEGVSRFVLSLIGTNLAFGAAVSTALWLIGVPHAALWGSLSALMRFVPYVGVPVAAALVAVFAAAADPGWTLVLWTIAAYGTLEVLVANVVEPNLYGRSSGLAPLTIVLSALFWGALWGPVGLVLSTPLTLCLVVAGRHAPALRPITILLGDAVAVSAAQHLYQRALAGEAVEALDEARTYLRRHTLSEYCDAVLLPAIGLAGADLRAHRIEARQENYIRETLASLAEALVDVKDARRRRTSSTDAARRNLGEHLRTLREARLGPWQGSIDVPEGSVVLCASLAVERDQVLSELLASALRDAGFDARSTILDPSRQGPGSDKAKLVSILFLMYPREECFGKWLEGCRHMRTLLPQACVAAVRVPVEPDVAALEESRVLAEVDLVVRSFCEAAALIPALRDKAAAQAIPAAVDVA